MSKQEKDGLVDCLFSGQGDKLTNLKFFRGSDVLIDEAIFIGEFCNSVSRRRVAKTLSEAPIACSKKVVDVAHFFPEV